MTPDVYGVITAAIVSGTTTLRVTVAYFTHPSTGTAFYTGVYDYPLSDRAITDDYIERDLRTNAAIVADGLRRYQTIQTRLGAVAGQRVKLA
jgi:hypothetical protein